MSPEDEARLAKLRETHVPRPGLTRPPECRCGDDWPCDVAFLLGVIDAREKEWAHSLKHLAEDAIRLGVTFPHGGKDE